MSRHAPRLAGILIASCLALGASPAQAGPDLMVVRLAGLEAVKDDVTRLAEALGREAESEALLSPVLSALDLGPIEWVDGRRPIAFSLPMQGMALGPSGVVLALPVERAAALDALAKEFGDPTEENGLLRFERGSGLPLFVSLRDGYAVVGAMAPLVEAFDLDAAIEADPLLPGTASVELYLEPLAPLIQAGLMQGRAVALASVPNANAGAEQETAGEERPEAEEEAHEGGTHAEGDDDAGAPHGEQDNDVSAAGEGSATAAGSNDVPAATRALVDLYFELFGNIVANISRLQASFSLEGDRATLHVHIIPVAGSTLDGLAAAQRERFPGVAKAIDAEGAFVALAGNITLTPQFAGIFKEFQRRYLQSMLRVTGTGVAAGEETSAARALLRLNLDQLDENIDCLDGPFAGAVRLGEDGSFGYTNIRSFASGPRCERLLDHSLELFERLPATGDGTPLARVQRDVFTYRDVRAHRIDIAAAAFAVPDGENAEATNEAKEEAEAASFLQMLAGGESFSTVTGQKGRLLLNAAGPGAKEAFRRLVDRLAGAGTAASTGRGLEPADFAPFRADAGLVIAADVRPIVRRFLEEAEALQAFAPLLELDDAAARASWGVHLAPGRLETGFSMPLELIRALAEVSRKAEEEVPEPPEPPDSSDPDAVPSEL